MTDTKCENCGDDVGLTVKVTAKDENKHVREQAWCPTCVNEYESE
jgi:hypothetical protein